MKSFAVLIAASLASSLAFAAKPCEELKSEIAAKIEAKGVKQYTLEIVAADKAGDQTVVGSCDGGSKKVVYAKK